MQKLLIVVSNYLLFYRLCQYVSNFGVYKLIHAILLCFVQSVEQQVTAPIKANHAYYHFNIKEKTSQNAQHHSLVQRSSGVLLTMFSIELVSLIAHGDGVRKIAKENYQVRKEIRTLLIHQLRYIYIYRYIYIQIYIYNFFIQKHVAMS